MKKFFVFITMVLVILSLVTPASANSADAPLMIEMLAGQNQHAGVIKAWDNGTSLYILYETATPWCLTETHLAVASSLADIPQKNGNPIPGQFPYKHAHNCLSSFLYTIPLKSGVCELYIAAHAVVKKPGSTETAWGNGLDFSGNNWGTYFTYKTTGCTATPPTETGTPPTGTATPPTETSTPPTGTATPPTETGTPPTGTATPPTETGTPPTGTATPPTGTSTPPPACQPTVFTADFSNLQVGQSIEGLGVAAPGLNIDAKGTAVKLLPNVDPAAYFSNVNGVSTINGNMFTNSGFTDLTTKNALLPHLYTFTFAPGLLVSNFSLHMLDFGDWNPTNSTNHYVSMTAYDAFGNAIAKQEISYSTPPVAGPQSSDIFGNLAITGDASASPGQPGNWTWNVSGSGIVKVVLEFGVGYDPNVAFDVLSFKTECP